MADGNNFSPNLAADAQIGCAGGTIGIQKFGKVWFKICADFIVCHEATPCEKLRFLFIPIWGHDPIHTAIN
jgi:hypothetical protein